MAASIDSGRRAGGEIGRRAREDGRAGVDGGMAVRGTAGIPGGLLISDERL